MRVFLLTAIVFAFITLLSGRVTAVETGDIQLAVRYHADIDIEDYLVSEKLDGIRARWTGNALLTRNGNRINAPAWFTDSWPGEPLDGELWTTRGDFQNIASIVLSDKADERWAQVRMMVFDAPAQTTPFEERIAYITSLVGVSSSHTLHVIPHYNVHNHDDLSVLLDKVTHEGGEGLMLHHKRAFYQDGRSQHLLKLKKFQDAEAQVIGYREGRGKYKGMLGSLNVRTALGIEFNLGTGFSDELRINPPPIGTWVTYKYYGKTDTGKPRFASFLRVRPEKELLLSTRAGATENRKQ